MGLLDIFKRKKSDNNKKDLVPVQNKEKTKSNNDLSIKIEMPTNKLPEPPPNDIKAIQAYTCWKQFDDCKRIIEITANPEVFFSRYNLLIERLSELEKMGEYAKRDNYLDVAFIKNQFIQFKRVKIQDFLYRMRCKTEEKLKTLKTPKAIENNINKFSESLEPYMEEIDEKEIIYINRTITYFKETYKNNTK